MFGKGLEVFIRLNADGRGLDQVLNGARTGMEKTGGAARRMARGVTDDFAKLNQAMNGWSSVSRLAAEAGLTISLFKLVSESARADKALLRIKQTASMTTQEMVALRKELHRMSTETGRSDEELRDGFDAAVQSGLAFGAALPVIDAVNVAMAVTNANSKALTGGLTVASAAFDFDLSKPGLALALLDKMVVAGRLGNAEMEALSGIFSRVGVNAAAAGMNFDQTLAFIEALSQVEKNPERLATLTDSTLRLFTNADYMKAAAKGAGVKFFDKEGARRDPVAVLGDIRTKFRALKTDLARSKFMDDAFGSADLDTKKGLQSLFTGAMLDSVSEFERQVGKAGGTLKRDLPEAISNAVDQTGRLGAALSSVADKFAVKFNAALTTPLAKFTADAVEKGDSQKVGEVVVGAAGILMAMRLAYKKMRGDKPGMLDRITGGASGLQQVFVTNWPARMLSAAEAAGQKTGNEPAGGPGAPPAAGPSRGARMKGGAMGAFKYGAPITASLAAYEAWNVYGDASMSAEQKKQAYAGVGGGAVGSIGGAMLGGAIGALFGGVGAVPGAMIGGAIGNMIGEAAGKALMDRPAQKVDAGGVIDVRVSDERVQVRRAETNDPGMKFNVHNGPYMGVSG